MKVMKVMEGVSLQLPVSQSRPLNPGGQVQETPLTRSRQVPPFWQGPEEHSSTSGGQRTRVSAQPGGLGVKGQVR